jgi:NADH:ubiquinone oxidoreductase subunit F (NADH-binding)
MMRSSRRVLRPVHAVPRRHGQSQRADCRRHWDELLADLSQVMRDASICGLGQAAPNPVDCVIKYFPNELS